MSVNHNDEHVLLEFEQGIATLTLNCASRRNSLDRVMAAALNDRIDEVWEVRDQLKGVVLCAAGDHFMVGGDIRYFETLLAQPEGGTDEIGALIHSVNHAVTRIDSLPCPVIAFVQGAVAGAGVSLALACDIVVAADDARFVLAYSALGATPDGGASWQLARRVGPQRALHMFLFNEPLDADQAHTLGLIAQRVVRADLDDTRAHIVNCLAKGSRAAQNAGKALIRSGMQTDLGAALEREKVQFVQLAAQDDFHEGVDAFIKKRPPVFMR